MEEYLPFSCKEFSQKKNSTAYWGDIAKEQRSSHDFLLRPAGMKYLVPKSFFDRNHFR